MPRAILLLLACGLAALAIVLLGAPAACADEAPARDPGRVLGAVRGSDVVEPGRPRPSLPRRAPPWSASRGRAGYDDGFWISRGAFSARVNATLQARYEAWRGEAGFALRRATLKLAGTAPGSTSWYAELELGDHADDRLREAWVQWSLADLLNVRLGRIRTATTRQLMTPPEHQQFVDVALASAFVGSRMPGYTDRNRDHGLMVHGRIGMRNAWSYLVTVTNGRAADTLALSARVNHAFRDPLGYREGTPRETTCGTYGEIGAWAYYYADRAHRPPAQVTDALRFGVDLAVSRGGFFLTGAATWGHDENAAGSEADHVAYLLQVGYRVPRSRWEVAVRWSRYGVDNPGLAFASAAHGQQPLGDGAVSELGLALNHDLKGAHHKLGLDLAYVFGPDADDGLLLRLQWQLAL